MSAPRFAIGLAVLSLAGCGKESQLSDAPLGPDANSSDSGAAIDAATDANPRGTVTVHVLKPDGSGAPDNTAVVVFLDPGGVLVAEPTADANGIAHADVLPGASVTALRVVSATDHQLDTILGVKPGDDLVIGTANPETPPAGTFSVDVGIPNVGSHYDVYGPCGSNSVDGPPAQFLVGGGGTLVPLTMYDNCKQATMDLLVVRQDGDITAAEVTGVPFVDGGSTAVTATYAPLQAVTASFSNVPASVGNIVISDNVPDARGYSQSSAGAPDAGTLTLNLTVPSATSALINPSFNGPGNATQYSYEQVDGTKASYALDVGAALLPWLDVPVFDPATAKLTVTMTGAGAVDLMYSYVEFSRPDPNGGGSGAPPLVYRWTTYSPTAGDITLPTLPTDLADNNPVASDNVNQTTASLYEASAVTSYDQVRSHLYNAFEAYYLGRGITGSLRVSTSPNTVGFLKLPPKRPRPSPAVHVVRDRTL